MNPQPDASGDSFFCTNITIISQPLKGKIRLSLVAAAESEKNMTQERRRK